MGEHWNHAPPAVKEQGAALAMSIGTEAAAAELGYSSESVRRWLRELDQTQLAAIVAQKRAENAAQIALRLAKHHGRVSDLIDSATTLDEARMARELATATGILGTKMQEFSGLGNGGGGRFGGDDSGTMSAAARAVYDQIRADLDAANPALLAQPATVLEVEDAHAPA